MPISDVVPNEKEIANYKLNKMNKITISLKIACDIYTRLPADKILGGASVEEEEFPWMVCQT